MNVKLKLTQKEFDVIDATLVETGKWEVVAKFRRSVVLHEPDQYTKEEIERSLARADRDCWKRY